MKKCTRCNRNSDWFSSFCPFCGSPSMIAVNSVTVVKHDVEKTVSEPLLSENTASFSKFNSDDSSGFASALHLGVEKPDGSDISFGSSSSNSLNEVVFTGHSANADDAPGNMSGSFSPGFGQSDNDDKKTEEA